MLEQLPVYTTNAGLQLSFPGWILALLMVLVQINLVGWGLYGVYACLQGFGIL